MTEQEKAQQPLERAFSPQTEIYRSATVFDEILPANAKTMDKNATASNPTFIHKMEDRGTFKIPPFPSGKLAAIINKTAT